MAQVDVRRVVVDGIRLVLHRHQLDDAAAVVGLLDRELDRVGGCDHDAHRHADREPQLVGEHDVRRVGNGDDDAVVLQVDRDRGVTLGELLGKQHRRLGLDHRRIQLDEGKLVLLGEDAGNLRAGRCALRNEDLADPAGGIGTFLLECRFELRGGDRAVANEQRAKRRPGRLSRFHHRVIGTRGTSHEGLWAPMRAVLQRVTNASVTVAATEVGSVGPGLLVLLGVAAGDDGTTADRLATKVAQLRIFEDEGGRFDRSLLDVRGGALVVSQFTLIADTRKGTRPSFGRAARPELAEPLVTRFCEALRLLGVVVETGQFGARMAVELVNDGPVTIVLDVD